MADESTAVKSRNNHYELLELILVMFSPDFLRKTDVYIDDTTAFQNLKTLTRVIYGYGDIQHV
ncbi:hypothetical protein BRD08_00565 [Halobacteriales archaeon SW_10_66_29]|nr:MAG: hypothetical protein BRD08_00565 [Halobacteriales archaeon SW_10_66_29]